MSSSNIRTVDSYAQEWLSEAKKSLKASTASRYLNAYESYIKPVVGNIICRELTSQDVQKVVESCADFSEKTSALILSVLKLITDYARKNGCEMQVNLQGYTSVQNKKLDLRILSGDELKRLNSAVLLGTDLTKMCIFLCMNTGIRVGELCALKREDIDFDKCVISVTKVMQRIQKKDGLSKTEVTVTELSGSCAKREIPLPRFVVDTVKPLFEPICKGCLLTTGTSTSCVEPRTMENRLNRICGEAGLSDVNFLALRHTFAARCAELGMDSYALSVILGLSDVTQVVKMYYKTMMVHCDVLEKLMYI